MHKNTLKRIFVTPGEPAGIGPDIMISLAQQAFDAELIVIADPDLLTQRARQLKQNIRLSECQLDRPAEKNRPGEIKILPVATRQTVIPGKLDPGNAAYVIETLREAAKQCLNNPNTGLVTGPVNKSVINEAGISFTGHTEFFAEQAGVEQTVMLFVTDTFKVALATTHLPLNKVASAINTTHLNTILNLLDQGLKKWFGIERPEILVCGLNPHAGENGHLGSEEIGIIKPAIDKARQQGINAQGPFPADTIFSAKTLEKADVILAMYHDQGLPVVKYASFGHAVNVTLGLPFLRTSVDHGTACDIAASGKADAGSLKAAINLAIKYA